MVTVSRGRPTGWIILCGVLAVAVVGVGIWGFNAQSDKDDAQAELAAQARAASAATPTATPTAAPAEVDPAIKEKFDQLVREFGATTESVDQIRQDLDQAAANVEKAKQSRDDATGALDAARADVEAFKAQFELTRTCLRGTLDAVGSAFEGGGLEAAVQQLQKLSGSCAS